MKKRKLSMLLAVTLAASLVVSGTAFASETKEEEKTEEKEEKAEEKEEKDEEKAEEAEEEGKDKKAEREEEKADKQEEKVEEDEEKLEEEEGEGGGEMMMGAPVVINNDEITAVENGDYVAIFGLLGSWTGGGVNDDGAGTPDLSLDNDYVYTAAIADIDGDIETYSNDALLESGDVTEDGATDVVIDDSEAGHNGIILYNAGNYDITNAQITMQTDADGNTTCDFSGQGSGIMVVGDTYATISDSTIDMAGVATMPVFVDDGATALIENSTLTSAGGTLYGDYMNSPDQASMVAPPWILGIMGTSRCTNLMGNDSTMHVVDSDTSSGAWAVLSTDSGSNMYLNIYNTSLTLNNADESAAAPLQESETSEGGDSQIYETLDNPYTTNYGSGYGTYVIGDAVETFAGAEINVGTYASIFTGGSATYMGLEEGQTYTLESATGETDYEYTATEDAHTVINSDTFGFMIHQSTDNIDIQEGTEINSGYDTFLVKSGSSNEELNATIDGATINNGGVLIQIMDNDDATNGGMMDVDDERNLNGNFMNFIPVHEENEGFNTEVAESDGSAQYFEFSNGSYSGNIYNASGSDNSDYGPLGGTSLMLTFNAADYSGAIAQTAAIHVTYDGAEAVREQGGYAYTEDNMDEILEYQNTSFDMTHYFDIGHVANLICDNNANTITVTLEEGATWDVTGDSVITDLTAIDSCTVIVEDGVSLTIGGEEYGPGTYTEEDFDNLTSVEIMTGPGPAVMDDEEGEAGEDAEAEEGEYSADMFNETDGQSEAMGMETPEINNGEITAAENGDYVAIFGLLGSWTGGGVNDDGAGTPDLDEDNDYVYTAAIADIDGDIETYSNDALLESGEVTEDGATDVVINDSEAGHNGIILYNAGNYDITNAQITMQTDADGNTTCDFSGQGSGIMVVGDTYATISDSTIDMAGVATMPIFVDDGATALIENSTLSSAGGTLYGDYMNSPDQATMVAPPWILGIMGTSRCTNLMGNDSTMHVVDSDTSSGAWAVLSTDSGSNMYLNIYNTSLTLTNADESAAAPLQESENSNGGDSQIYETLDNPYTTNYGSGYGTYVIGDAVETFAGAEINVGTYASIFTGGTATYTSIEEGETYTLESATGETDYEYTAEEDKNTVINSDTFGFMIHQSEDVILIEEGTEINSGYDTFLVKSGSSNEELIASVDGATINNGGVLIQIMDNDDATTGGMMDVDDERNLNGNFMNFMPVHEENEGFNTDEAEADGSSQYFMFSNGTYSGNIYNASGSDNSDYGPLGGTDLMVGFDAADYSGAIAQTAAIHVTYDGAEAVKAQGGYAYTEDNMDEILEYQNPSFDMTHYFDIGHVANLICDNGANTITVTMQDSATWTVTGDSVISALYAIDDSTIIVEDGVTLTVGGQEYGPGTYTGDDFDVDEEIDIESMMGPGPVVFDDGEEEVDIGEEDEIESAGGAVITENEVANINEEAEKEEELEEEP